MFTVKSLNTHTRNNPEGRVIIIGYSLGGEKAMQVQESLSKDNISVNALYTIDGTPRNSDERSNVVTDNTKTNINYYQTNQTGDAIKDALNLHGGENRAADPSKTVVDNKNMSTAAYKGEKMSHYNIDGATMGRVVKDVLTRTESKMTTQQINQVYQKLSEQLKKLETN